MPTRPATKEGTDCRVLQQSQGQNDCSKDVGGCPCPPAWGNRIGNPLLGAPPRRANAMGPPLPRPQHGRSRAGQEPGSRLPGAAARLDDGRPASTERGPPRGDSAGGACSQPTPPSCRKLHFSSRKLQPQPRQARARSAPAPRAGGPQKDPCGARPSRRAPRGPPRPGRAHDSLPLADGHPRQREIHLREL